MSDTWSVLVWACSWTSELKNGFSFFISSRWTEQELICSPWLDGFAPGSNFNEWRILICLPQKEWAPFTSIKKSSPCNCTAGGGGIQPTLLLPAPHSVPSCVCACVCVLKPYFNIFILTEIYSYRLIECNLTWPMPSEPKNLVHGLLKKERKQICNLVYFYQLQMYIKDPLSNAAKTKSMNLTN